MWSSQQPAKLALFFFPNLQMKKLRLGEVKELLRVTQQLVSEQGFDPRSFWPKAHKLSSIRLYLHCLPEATGLSPTCRKGIEAKTQKISGRFESTGCEPRIPGHSLNNFICFQWTWWRFPFFLSPPFLFLLMRLYSRLQWVTGKCKLKKKKLKGTLLLHKPLPSVNHSRQV